METRSKQSQHQVLIVDDEEDIRDILQFNLESEGYQIRQAGSAEEALDILGKEPVRLIILDVMMSGMSGFKMAQQIRKEGNSVPIIFLTAKNCENDMLSGFSIGADDYITKPFSIKEVVARVKSVLRRATHMHVDEEQPKQIIFDSLVIDLQTMRVSIDEQPIELTVKEFNILRLLMEHPGSVYSRSDILQYAWEDDTYVLERTVDVHITRLRKKIGRYATHLTSRTGYGYSFIL